MKIIQIIPGTIWGGAEQYIVDLGEGLRERGHEVIYACRDVEAVTSQLESRGIRYLTFTKMDIGFLRFSKILKDWVKSVDIVHIHDTSFMAPVARVISNASSHARIILTRHESHRKPIGMLFRKPYNRLSTMICVSDFVRRQWLRSNNWFPEDKCRVVLNSIPDYTPVEADSIRDKFNIGSDQTLLMFCGRVRRSKGCDVLLEALAQLRSRDWHIVFVGSCYPKDYMYHLQGKAESMRIGNRIHFYGFTRYSRQLMGQADVGVSPSIVKDSCPLTNLEFMQRGVCVVASSSGGQPECMRNGESGFIVPPDDVESLAKTLRRLLDDSILRESVARNGKSHFDNDLSYNKFLDRIEQVYQEAWNR